MRQGTSRSITLDLTIPQETTLAVMLIRDAGNSERLARRAEELNPDGIIALVARERADEKLNVYNQFNKARDMPTVTADEIMPYGGQRESSENKN